jgi:hypothetical protein
VAAVFEGEVYCRELGFQLNNHIIIYNDITITTAIARKLRLTLMIDEHFEFAIHAAQTVKISACTHCMHRSSATSARLPKYNMCSCCAHTKFSSCRSTVALINCAIKCYYFFISDPANGTKRRTSKLTTICLKKIIVTY